MQEPREPTPGTFPFSHSILFTGHMIDAPTRTNPRFPAAAESAVRSAIHEAVSALLTGPARTTIGIAGGACGGDILFHEACAALGIPTRMFLALPPAEFIRHSVAHAGPAWIHRFEALTERLGPRNICVMTPSDGLPKGTTDNLWERANLWMIEEALRLAPARTLLALWDGKGGDGPGGTEHLVEIAAAQGLRIAPILSMEALAAPHPAARHEG